MEEEASPPLVSGDNVPDTCASSDSEEKEPSVKNGDETGEPEPGECPAVSSAAGGPETEKNDGAGPGAAKADEEGGPAQAAPDPLQVEAEGEAKCASDC